MNQILDAGKPSSKTNSGKRIVWVVTFAVVAILATAVGALLLLGYGFPPPASSTGTSVSESASSAASQTNEGGGVIVSVEWQGRNAGPVFTVTMATHSIDLDTLGSLIFRAVCEIAEVPYLVGKRSDLLNVDLPVCAGPPTSAHSLLFDLGKYVASSLLQPDAGQCLASTP